LIIIFWEETEEKSVTHIRDTDKRLMSMYKMFLKLACDLAQDIHISHRLDNENMSALKHA